jgi:tRNA pseudouridine55 synthase
MDGILVVNKPRGITSHDVVSKVRRIAGQKRVGHAGTLDPLAMGVLLVCLGKATRVAEYLAGSDKTYRAVMRLGIETDTYDADGQIVATQPVSVSESELRAALNQFAGEVDQVPPMYSALKREGQPLYKLARKGIEVEREPRRVTIDAITLREFQLPDVTIDVRCSAGTYIRSLAHDVGAKLACGAHLIELTRLASGAFTIDEAVRLEDLSGLELTRLLRPLDAALQNLPAITLDVDQARRVVMGQAIALDVGASPAEHYRVYNDGGVLLAIMTFDPAARRLSPHKVLAES